ncbi:TIGR04222 domain-containing membrane protein [Candidatus Albibeggiatoa sp. nov. NOAA]|uniref:TIGR04222 domain-containing membrane protein n=1 Tax=Candidatus Albibeggiatoa sp. nov. NOAA TaxID=3162724 RepID=UPI0033018ABA|nr:TIGR04222 domain-containing membrane protein [Thiotrichaceae bacterium]
MEFFINISGQQFLIFFIVFSTTAILLGYWFQRHDNTGQYRTPAIDGLTAIEVAALRGEDQGIIHATLFKLWQNDAILVKGVANHASISIQETKPRLNTEIEKAIYRYISGQRGQKCKPTDLFQSTSSLSFHLHSALHTIYQNLEQRHLRHTDKAFQQRKRIATFAPLSITVVGGLKLGFGIWYGHPILILTLLLFVMILTAISVLSKPSRQTILGRRYLKQCENKIKATTILENNDSGLWRIAILGIAELESWEAFNPYVDAFGYLERKTYTGNVLYTDGNVTGYEGDSHHDGESGGCGGCGGSSN